MAAPSSSSAAAIPDRGVHPTLPTALVWVLLFAAVLTHLPAIGFDFAQDDFDSLARAAGLSEVSGWPLRPFSTWIVWSAQWPLFGTAPAGYHGTALLALAALSLATARVARRLGAPVAGAGLAGLLVLLGPTTWLPVAWVSAAAEIWAVLFAVVALDLWLDPRGGPRPLLGILFAGLSLLAKEPGLGLFLLLPLGLRWTPPSRRARPSTDETRARIFLLGVLAVGAALVAAQVGRAFDTGPAGAYALGGPLVVLHNLFLLIADAAWPWTIAPRGAAGVALGAILLLGWVLLAIAHARRHRRQIAFALLWALATLAPVLALRDHLYSYYALGAQVAVAWTVGLWWGPRLQAAVDRDRRRAGALLAAGLVAVMLVGTSGVHRVTHARGEDGRLVDPILHRTSITADVRAQLDALRSVREVDELVVLQAARIVLPDTLSVPDGAEVILRSPVHLALRGNRGLRLLLGPEVDARWVTHLDETGVDAQVMLDVADDRLRMLGPVENARLYSGLIAAAAGQFSRARHDFWNSIRLQGAEVRFAFDPDLLPIQPEELDAEAPAFARYLLERGDAGSLRVLRLFEQIYEEVRGRELLRDLDRTERAPRFGG